MNKRSDHCTWVNGLCPYDLCVLPFGHVNASKRHHITGTTLGSINTSAEEQRKLLRSSDTEWDRTAGYLAPRYTSRARLIELGWQLQWLMLTPEERLAEREMGREPEWEKTKQKLTPKR